MIFGHFVTENSAFKLKPQVSTSFISSKIKFNDKVIIVLGFPGNFLKIDALDLKKSKG